MNKVLGIDLGTNSLGWAIVEQGEKECLLIDKGVCIFDEGVKIEKGVEQPKAADRTKYRLARRQKFRRKLRKYETLKVLIKNNMCPLTTEELDRWIKYKKGQKKEYPKSKAFLDWLKTDEEKGINPYFYRAKAAKEKLKPEEAGRALYHIAQRRGYKSNRLESTKEKEHGTVKDVINEISKNKGDKTLGEYFYILYQKGEKIRNKYTSREEHYIKEFYKICEVQGFNEKLKKDLERAIFYQRSLKSQKGLVGKCTFEPSKPRCPLSHPLFEKFRMLSFINTIKYKDDSGQFVFLTEEDRGTIRSLFLRKSKPNFVFEEIRKKLSGKTRNLIFNYKDYTLVSGCPTTTQLIEILGDDWRNFKKEYIREKDGKKSFIDYETIWHVLFNFTDDEKIKEFGIKRLGLDEETSIKFSKIKLKQGYANLSLCAIRKILPHLENGLLYSHAVYFANLDKVLKDKPQSIKEKVKADIKMIIDNYNKDNKIIATANRLIEIKIKRPSTNITDENINIAVEKEFDKEFQNEKEEILKKVSNLVKKEVCKKEPKFIKNTDMDVIIKNKLNIDYDIPHQCLEKLYHPSNIDIYPEAKPTKDGKKYLGSPRTQSVRNPMAMKALHQLRYLINTLIKDDKISSDDTINIELARELNDANMRAAIKRYQNELEKKKKEYSDRIKEKFKSNYNPTDTDVIKYQLWEEQGNNCIYTGKKIKITDFISDNPKFDIEHTIPRSISFDDSHENKTLCDVDYNRNIKKNKMPSELPKNDYELILERINPWLEKIKNLNEQIFKAKMSSKTANTKEEKDKAIQWKHYLTLQKNYWQGKYNRFIMSSVPEGFSNRQFVDTTVITKYARAYLKTVFNNVFTVKGIMTANFRKLWGLQDEYSKKERVSHIHHTIDAIVIACINKGYNNLLSEYYKKTEDEREHKPKFKKPWDTFTEDIKKIEDKIIAKHYSEDNALKQSKKKLRVREKIKYHVDKDGNKNPIYLQGNTFRGSLHQDTFYGAITKNIEDKIEKDKNGNIFINYVIKKELTKLKADDVKKIVDKNIRKIITKAVDDKIITFKNDGAVINGIVWMNENKNIQIKKVRIYSRLTNPIPLKKQRDLSKYHYKQSIYVANDENSVLGIYEGEVKGKVKRDFELLNNYDISKGKLLQSEKNGLKLIYTIKKGTMVLLYENSPEEIYKIKDNYIEINKRLYKLFKFDSNGQIYFIHHLEARPKGELKSSTKFGAYQSNDELWSIRMFYPSQLNILIENKNFIITNDSKIVFLNNS